MGGGLETTFSWLLGAGFSLNTAVSSNLRGRVVVREREAVRSSLIKPLRCRRDLGRLEVPV